jgi:PleD family two-component response regulator
MQKILIADDDPAMRGRLRKRLADTAAVRVMAITGQACFTKRQISIECTVRGEPTTTCQKQ